MKCICNDPKMCEGATKCKTWKRRASVMARNRKNNQRNKDKNWKAYAGASNEKVF